MTSLDLTYVSAPMVNQSDAPFRILTRRYGATLAYTQMLDPHKLLDDREYLEFHLRDIKAEEGHGEGLNVVEELGDDGPCLTRRRREAYARPVIVQLCGNDPQVIVKAARQVQPYCDGIDLNLGCPQEHAREGHFGGYLLGKKDWPLIQSITSAMAHSLLVPTSAKIRLCPSTTPTSATATFGRLLEHAGASWVTLHARHVSSKRRRQGAADLDAIRALKDALSIPVISNGNVRTFDDVRENLQYTGADGAMVGETLLGNPTLFAGGDIPDPVHISLEYLSICKQFPGVSSLQTIQTHVRRFVEFQCVRRPWYSKFRSAIYDCSNIDDIEVLLCGKVNRWRGKAAKALSSECDALDGFGGKQEVEGTHDRA